MQEPTTGLTAATPADAREGSRPMRSAAIAARSRIRSRIAGGLEASEASDEQLSEGVCAICLEPLFAVHKGAAAAAAAPSASGTAKRRARYRQNVCKRVVELVSCGHAFHNTCLMRAARDAPRDAAGVWLCPLCRKRQKPLEDPDHFSGWRMLTVPPDD